ncbi:MAG: EAL domain-containing protein [Gallionella sp.]|nr:EAL domain-containing protein [Gallionella sp.]
MNTPYLSIRWKIILLASLVLGLTSALFIWQQYRIELNEFDLKQAEYRERSQLIVEHLFLSQAERMQLLASLLVEQPNIRGHILNKRSDQLAQAVEAIATELSFAQGVVTVEFHDSAQKSLAAWGDLTYSDSLVSLARLSVTGEKPQTRVLCDRICVHLTVIPISHVGHTVASVAIISNLETVLNDLHRLTNSDVATLYSKAQNDHAPISEMQIVSVSGGAVIREVLEAARIGFWLNGYFQLDHGGQVHQVALIPVPLMGKNPVYFAIVSDITRQIEAIASEAKVHLLRGMGVLFLAMLLMYAMLRPTMRRIHHVSQILPLLGQEKFAQVREDYAARPLQKWLGGRLKDEVDELESLALALADQLERLRSESIRHTDSLAAQASQLKHERDFISGLLDTAPVFILSYGSDGCIQLANAYAVESCGLTEVLGHDYATLFTGISQQEYAVEMSTMEVGVVSRLESRITQNDGSIRNVLWFNSLLAAELAETPTYLSIGMDITEHRENEAKIHDLAFYDPLTKLPNRCMLLDCVRHAMSSSVRKHFHCALIFIDLDHFKAINDSKGQEIGDQLLIETAKRLHDSVREIDTVAHLSGDEFVVLVEELNSEAESAVAQISLVAEKLRVAISQPCLLQGFACHLTASVGISLFKGNEVAVDELLRYANIAMSHAKESGRNALCVFDPSMLTGLEARAALEDDLRHALPQDQLRLFYQVQMNAAAKPVGVEALLRWFHPERGLIPPLQFIPVAEETGLILPIGLWILETACAQLKAWETDTLTSELQLAVNVSARQFYQPDFVAIVLHTLEKTGANPARLKLELTESMVLVDISDAIAKMQQLKNIGVRLSIDDFGTAYSSLSYLTQLPLDQLKIDQSFVRNIGVNPSDAVIVQTIINMANDLGMDVIAEGVETQAQREFLGAAGCMQYQGYLYSKPIALDAFTDYMKTSRV